MQLRNRLCLVLIAGVLGCGGGTKHAAGGTSPRVAAAAAEALTDGLSFAGGIVKSGGIPAASNEKVTLDPGSDKLTLVPAESTLMPLDITNPDEDKDPVAATLVQFGDDANAHVEIMRMQSSASADAGTSASDKVHIDLHVAVGKDTCKDLCNDKITVKMLLAALLSGGGVGQHAIRNVDLDCTADGDASKCGDGASTPAKMGSCTPDKKRCSDNGVQTCGKDGEWGASRPCVEQACVGGACTGVCEPGAGQCIGNVPQACDVTGQWQSGTKCKGSCLDGLCVPAMDAGTDAGHPDAGHPDAGHPDAGHPDAGHPQPDSGTPDAGTPDAGPPCFGGSACAFADNVCHEGITVCGADRHSSCQDNGPKVNGASCGADHVCFLGNCVACKVGDVCDMSNVCEVGTFDSCTGGPHCALNATAADGTQCGSAPDLVCSHGICVTCEQGTPCTPASDCHNGLTDCSNGPACVDQQTNALDGARCASNGGTYCKSGICSPCTNGDACSLAGQPCRVGTITCGPGPSCTGSGALAPDGSDCGSGKVCMTGNCVTTSWTLAVVGGDAQTAYVDQVISPVTVSVKDSNNTPVPNVTVQITTPAGAYAPATASTNASGIATIVPRLGRAVGVYTFTVSSSAAPSVQFHATAIAPPKGTIFNVVDQSHANGQDGLNGPATMAHVSNAYAVVAALDGTLYFSDQCSVYTVSLAGVIKRVAGTGSCTTTSPDIGAATSVPLYEVYDLALDETNGFLYLVDGGNNKVRQVDLGTGTLQTWAGGGTTTSTDYGDNQTATYGVLSGANGVSVDPNGNVYISDTGHNRFRKVDTQQTITTWMVGSSTCPQGLALHSVNNYSKLYWDASGQMFISAYFCGSQTSGYTVYGIARVEQDSSLTLIAGNYNGQATGDGIQATAAYFPSLARIAFDAAGNIFTATQNDHRIRRIDGVSGIITTVAGSGTSGYKGDYVDGVTGTSAQFYYPFGIAIDAQGTVFVADEYNYTLRAISGVGDSTPNSATLAIQAGDGQQAAVDALFSPSLAVSLTDKASQPITGANIGWKAIDAGSGLANASTPTDLSGIATVGGRVGLAIGAYRFQARYRDLHGHDVAGSPMPFQVSAIAPPNGAGTVFTIVNTDHTGGAATQAPTPGTYQHMNNNATSVVVGSDGTVYIAESYQVWALSPAGVLTPLAGLDTAGGTFAGDGGPASSGRFNDIEGLALDETTPSNRKLFVNDHGNSKIRIVTLDTSPPAVNTFVGYTGGGTAPGSPNYGVPGPGTGVNLGSVYGMRFNPADHNLYLVEAGHNRILQVDPSGNVTSWLVPTGSCSGPINLYSLPGYADMAWAPGGVSYISAYVCGTSTNQNAVFGILQRAANGTLSWIAGQNSSTGVQTDGATATNTYFPTMGPILLGAGNASLYVSVYNSHEIRLISALDGSGTVTTIAGTGTSGFSGDYGPANMAQFYQPWGTAVTASGHLIVADYYNDAFREIW